MTMTPRAAHRALLPIVLLAALGARADAQPRPNPLFADGAVLQRDARVPVWGTASPGERVTVRMAGQRATATADADGAWRVTLAPLRAGGPHVLTVAGRDTVRVRDVLVGEVWVASGQSNMALALGRAAGADTVLPRSADSLLRVFVVGQDTSETPLRAVRRGTWARADSASLRGFSAVAYFFARDLRRALGAGVPVGVIGSYWGGTNAEAWTPRAAMTGDSTLETIVRQRDAERRDPSMRTTPVPRNPHWIAPLYNAMVAPLHPYAIRGVVWYQAESNATRAAAYRSLFPALVRGWRSGWGQGDFPFVYVQLPNYLPNGAERPRPTWAEMRAAQLHASRVLPNVAMVVTTDQGDPADLHPTRKDVVGARLARAARAVAYGERVAWSGPRWSSMTVRGDTAVLAFTHVGGSLVLRADSLPGAAAGFEVAAADGRWAPARAAVRGDRLHVWSDAVRAPTAIRYGWADAPPVTLYDTEGLPASPFRTDDAPPAPRRPRDR